MLAVLGNDGDVEIESRLYCEVGAAGKVLVYGQSLADVLHALPDRGLDIRSCDKGGIELTCGGSKYRIAGPHGLLDDFPVMPNADMRTHPIPAAAFAQVLNRTTYLLCKTEQYPKNALRLECSPKTGMLRAVATDGTFLSLAEVKVDPVENMGLTLGMREAELLAAVAAMPESPGGNEQPLSMSLGERLLQVGTGQTMLTCGLVEKPYPKYQQSIPAQTQYNLRAKRQELLDTVSRILIVSDEYQTILVKPHRSTLTVEGKAVTGTSHEDLAAECTHKAPALSLNGWQVKEALKRFVGEDVLLDYDGEFSPVRITCPGDSCLVVTMPLRE
jgi:DNA polymerase III sliding clamp (beta) subunit (PCNA family)